MVGLMAAAAVSSSVSDPTQTASYQLIDSNCSSVLPDSSLFLSPGVSESASSRRRKCVRPGVAVSPWKSAYIRQHRIENNWRKGDTREPLVRLTHTHTHSVWYVNMEFCHWVHLSVSLQVLKGHDDHVITCLQFSGDLIVSGSDDNTLKVWSAITGKVGRSVCVCACVCVCECIFCCVSFSILSSSVLVFEPVKTFLEAFILYCSQLH